MGHFTLTLGGLMVTSLRLFALFLSLVPIPYKQTPWTVKCLGPGAVGTEPLSNPGGSCTPSSSLPRAGDFPPSSGQNHEVWFSTTAWSHQHKHTINHRQTCITILLTFPEIDSITSVIVLKSSEHHPNPSWGVTYKTTSPHPSKLSMHKKGKSKKYIQTKKTDKTQLNTTCFWRGPCNKDCCRDINMANAKIRTRITCQRVACTNVRSCKFDNYVTTSGL